MAGLPHRLEVPRGPPASSTGKIPYVTLPDGTQLHDSGLIIEELSRRHSVDLDAGLSAEQKARGHAIRRMVEEHLYFVSAWERWGPPEARAITVRDYFSSFPPILRTLVGWKATRGILQNLHGQGLGRLSPEQIRAAGKADLEALSLLIEGPFVLGAPSTVDATVFAFLWGIGAHPLGTPLARAMREQGALMAYRERMRARYWPEAAF
jgi:glutathione S-transferase